MYHDSNKTFPPGVTFAPGELAEFSTNFGKNWIICILPMIDELNLYNQFDFSQPVSSNVPTRFRPLRTVLWLGPHKLHPCSARAISAARYHSVATSSTTLAMARGRQLRVQRRAGPLERVVQRRTKQQRTQKLLVELPLDHGRHGLQQCVEYRPNYRWHEQNDLAGEIRIGVDAYDRRGVWAMGAAGSSTAFQHGENDDNGPNVCGAGSDNLSVAKIQNAVGLLDCTAVAIR